MNIDKSCVVAMGSNLALEGLSAQAVLEAALERLPGEGLTVLRRSRW